MLRLFPSRFARAAVTNGRRFMATDTSRATLPAETHGVAGRYASALWLAASKNNTLDAVEKDLDQVASAIVPGETFERFLMDPTISKKEKAATMAEACSGGAELSQSLFDIMSDAGRLSETSATITAFKKLMAAHRKEVSAVVTAAHELDSEELAMAKDAITARLKEGETLTLTTAVDEKLIGGVTIAIGDKFVDLSIARQIKDIEKLLEEPM
mmetsp:Transcript_101574/g.152175  ORF Transcript_101574/g.152175 Transcript_101574/m.152175 type:complete len:213 (-) Transcript_101574:182-820(-)